MRSEGDLGRSEGGQKAILAGLRAIWAGGRFAGLAGLAGTRWARSAGPDHSEGPVRIFSIEEDIYREKYRDSKPLLNKSLGL